jgi:CheY-like chemotaxis protein
VPRPTWTPHVTTTLVTRHSLREHRKGATILLVDASRDSQLLAAHFLGREDCSVVVASDLKEALSALDQDLYDVVLVDTSLEGLQGDDAAKVLRDRMRDTAATRFIAITEKHTKAFDKAKLAIGFDATLAKPVPQGCPALRRRDGGEVARGSLISYRASEERGRELGESRGFPARA